MMEKKNGSIGTFGLYPCYSNLVLEPVPAEAPGSLLEMQTLSIQPRPPESESTFLTRSPDDSQQH